VDRLDLARMQSLTVAIMCASMAAWRKMNLEDQLNAMCWNCAEVSGQTIHLV
jgi:hypothetical protein